jgi:exopolyphosphatase
VVKHIEFLQNKAGDEAKSESASDVFLDTLERFSKDRELDLYTLMTTSTSADGQFQRELLLWAFSDRGVTAAKAFATKSAEELGLEDWHGSIADATRDASQWRKVWWQREVQHSRKRVAPLIRETMS